MKKLKFRLIRISVLLLGIALLLINNPVHFGLKSNTAFAVGDLTIDWGVPAGDPIFTVLNMLPGDIEDRDVEITNDGIVTHGVSVKGVKTGGSGNIESVLDFVVSVGGVDIYGGTTGVKTLAQFFTDSSVPDGLFLFNLDPSETKTVNFEATLPTSVGNEFQLTSVIFDLTIGIVGAGIEIPGECSQITFSGDPIIGTAIGDYIVGTSGNDLIFGLGGGDVIDGKGGDDCLVGGDIGDSIYGRDGNDVLIGEGSGDTLIGGGGNDQIFGGEGGDGLFGNDGDDLLIGGDGADHLEGGNGKDKIFGNAGMDSLKGGSDDDELDGGTPGYPLEVVNGQTGWDTCANGVIFNCEVIL